ncbi:MAG: InlB B-repeat-containing protein, partial [Clostridia bacterium]|nr:InlB B-repeat-containing protein [Clostridia bacterium]
MRKMAGILLVMLLLIQTLVTPFVVIAEGADDAQVTQVNEPMFTPVATPEPVPQPTTAPDPGSAEKSGGSVAETEPESDPKSDPLLKPAPAANVAPRPVNMTETTRYLVDFYDYNGTRIASQYVEEGQAATQPRPPQREGYAFTGWQPPVDHVTSDMQTYATYKRLNTYSVILSYYYKESGDPVIKEVIEFYMEGEPVDKIYEAVPVAGYEPETPTQTLSTAAIDRDYLFEFVYIAGSDTTYTVEHHFEQLDGSYVADTGLTQRLAGPTGTLVKAEPLPNSQISGFSPDLIGEGRIAADGSTVLQVRYQRLRFTVTFDTAQGGTYFQPVVLSFGAPLQPPGTPARDGYTFGGWAVTPSQYDPPPTSMPASDLVFTAKWTPVMVSYRLVYWLEKTDIPGDPGTDTDNYVYERQEERQAPAGSSLSLGAGDVGTIKYAEFRHADQAVPIKGDGTTVVNVFFKRVVYTLTFSLNTTDATATMVTNGQTYTINNPYIIRVKYQQTIGNIWPSLKNTVFTMSFRGWRTTFDVDNWVTHRFIFTEDMIPPNGATSYTVNALWDPNVGPVRVNYWFEALPGQTGISYVYNGLTHILSGYDSQDLAMVNGSTINVKAINGMGSGAKPANLQLRGGTGYIGDYSTTQMSQYGNEFNFFYTRLRFTLSFNAMSSVTAPRSIVLPFGMALDQYDPLWS